MTKHCTRETQSMTRRDTEVEDKTVVNISVLIQKIKNKQEKPAPDSRSNAKRDNQNSPNSTQARFKDKQVSINTKSPFSRAPFDHLFLSEDYSENVKSATSHESKRFGISREKHDVATKGLQRFKPLRQINLQMVNRKTSCVSSFEESEKD